MSETEINLDSGKGFQIVKILGQMQEWELEDFFRKGANFKADHGALDSDPVVLFENDEAIGELDAGDNIMLQGQHRGNKAVLWLKHRPNIQRPQLRRIK